MANDLPEILGSIQGAPFLRQKRRCRLDTADKKAQTLGDSTVSWIAQAFGLA